MYKVVFSLIEVATEQLLMPADTHTRANRKRKFRRMNSQTNSYKYSSFSWTITEWDKLDDCVTTSPTVAPFKEHLKKSCQLAACYAPSSTCYSTSRTMNWHTDPDPDPDQSRSSVRHQSLNNTHCTITHWQCNNYPLTACSTGKICPSILNRPVAQTIWLPTRQVT